MIWDASLHESIDRESFVPYYHQIKVIIGDRIRRGDLRPDDPLPSEHDLARAFNVSRATVRKALADLAAEGLTYSVQGKGNFVAKPKLEQSLFRFYSLGRDLPVRGLALESQILTQREISLPTNVTRHLRRTAGEKGAHITRIRLLDGIPLALETAYIVGEAYPALLEADLVDASIYDVAEAATGRSVLKAEEFLEPVVCDQYQAKLLQCEPGQPAFQIERLSYLEETRPFELRLSLIRGDRFRFYTELR